MTSTIIHNDETIFKLEELVGRLDRLPPLPETIFRINQMIDSKEATLNGVGEEVAKDLAISAQVLQLVNSSFYGFSDKVSSIKQAVVLLGINAVRTLISTSWVSAIMGGISIGFHHHAMATARACYVISRSLGVGEPEELSAIGLLHDVGKVVISEHLPDEYAQIHALAKKEHICFHDAEQEIIGVDHAAIGSILLEKWHLPASTIIPVEYHHYSTLPEEYAQETAVLILANLFVRAEGYGYVADDSMPEFRHEIGKVLDLEIEDLEMLYNEVCDQMNEIPRYIGDRAV